MEDGLDPHPVQRARPEAVMLGLVLLVAFLLRLIVCFGLGLPSVGGDTGDYLRMGLGILAGDPVSYFPNGYPLLVAATAAVTGTARLTPALVLLNVLMSTATVYGTFALARALMPVRFALLAAGLVAVWPNQINFTRFPASEVPATLLLVLGLLMAVRGRPLAAGLLLGAMVLMRSSLAPVVPLAALLLLLDRRIRGGLLLLAGTVVVLAAEQGMIRLGVIRPASNLGMNLMISIVSDSSVQIRYKARALTDAQKARPFLTYGQFILEHPGRYLWQRLTAVWELWGPWPFASDPKAPRSVLSSLLIGLRCPAVAAALWAAWRLRAALEVRLLALPILVVTGVHLLFFGQLRFTFPAEPAMLVLVALLAACWRGAYPPSASRMMPARDGTTCARRTLP